MNLYTPKHVLEKELQKKQEEEKSENKNKNGCPGMKIV